MEKEQKVAMPTLASDASSSPSQLPQDLQHPTQSSEREAQASSVANTLKQISAVSLIGIILTSVMLLFGMLLARQSTVLKSQTADNSVKGINTPKPSDAATLPTPTSTPDPTLPLANHVDTTGKIAFISENNIWLVNADDTQLQQLTNDHYAKFHMSASPDGKKIVYAFHPANESQQIDMGMFESYASGLAEVDILTKEVKTLQPYGPHQDHYPVWSPDSLYISVWQSEGRVGSRILKASTGEEVFKIAAKDDRSVSPIVWMKDGEKISYIENGNLVTSNMDGTDKKVIVTRADDSQRVFEGPPHPQPPLWSKSGRYVFYLKNSDSYVKDTGSGKTFLVESKAESDYGTYSAIDFLGFNEDETIMFIRNTKLEENTIEFDLVTGKSLAIDDFEQPQLSPNKEVLFGNLDVYPYAVGLISTDSKTKVSCAGQFKISRYTWFGNDENLQIYSTWSPDSKGVLGYNDEYPHLSVLNSIDCSVFPLKSVAVAETENAIWVP